MSRAWLAFAPEDERITVWLADRRPQPGALRMDARVLDRNGAPASVSLVLAPPGVRLKFDDLAVQQARRRVLAGPYPDAVTTLLSDDSHFEGSLSVIRGGDYDDPFARVFPARLLRVEAGLFGRVPPPAGPTIERYGSAQPWPWDRFSAP
jgi:hypothetical protein